MELSALGIGRLAGPDRVAEAVLAAVVGLVGQAGQGRVRHLRGGRQPLQTPPRAGVSFMSLGTQSQDTSSYKTTRVVC